MKEKEFNRKQIQGTWLGLTFLGSLFFRIMAVVLLLSVAVPLLKYAFQAIIFIIIGICWIFEWCWRLKYK